MQRSVRAWSAGSWEVRDPNLACSRRTDFFYPANTPQLGLISFSASAQDKAWQSVTIDDSITIDFPGNPIKKIFKEQEIHALGDGHAMYMAFSQENVIAPEVTDAEKQEFYTNVLEGALDEAGGGKIENRLTFTIAGFQGVEANLRTSVHPNSPSVKYMRLILVNGVLYNMVCLSNEPLNESFATDRHRFFASFHPKVHKVASTPAKNRDSACQLGRMMGNVFVYGGIIAIIVVVLRRSERLKKKKQAS